MGQKCSCEDDCAGGPAVEPFQKPEGATLANPGGGSNSGLVKVEAARYDELAPKEASSPRVASAARIPEQGPADPDDVPEAPQPAAEPSPDPSEAFKQAVEEAVMEIKLDSRVAPRCAARSEDVFSFQASLVAGVAGDLGMTYVEEERLLSVVVVTGIREGGAAAAWNAEQAGRGLGELRIRRGDRVVAASGHPREQALDPCAHTEGSVAITVQRWQDSYEIQLKRERATDKLGMKLELFERSSGGQDVKRMIRIGEVRAGLLEAWNAQAAADGRPHEVVTPGTEITRVGALAGPPEDIMTSLQEGDVDMTVRRPELAKIESAAADRGIGLAPFPGA